MKRMKKLGVLLLATALSAAMTIPAFAAYSYIDKLNITIDHSIQAGAGGEEDEWEFTVDTDTKHVYIDEEEDVDVTNAPKEYEAWDDNIKPKAKIVVRVDEDDDWRFASDLKKEDVTVTVNGPVDMSKYEISKSSKKVTITVTLEELEYPEGYWEDRLEVSDLEWDDETGVGSWEENEYADYYEVRAYRGSTGLMSITKTEDTEYNFAQYFTRKGDYKFRVRAYHGDHKGAWEESYEISVDAEEAEDIYANRNTSSGSTSNNTSSNNSSNNNAAGPNGSTEGAWLKDSVGWWWCRANKTYPTSTWELIQGKWYYFNEVGYCVLNTWVQTNGLWYYCGSDGDMWVSRWTPDGYWVNADGVWVQ